jgi:DNA-binding NarL/FixJ family response regulator
LNRVIRILVWCPNSLTMELLTDALARQSKFCLVASPAAPEELGRLDQDSIDVALITCDLSQEECEGLRILRTLREGTRRTKAVVLLEKREREPVIQAFRLGAKGVFSIRDSEFKMLCRCVECIHKGQIWASGEELGWVMEEFETSIVQPGRLDRVNAAGVKLLSPREEDLVRLLMEGLSNREVAGILNLSRHTVKNYLSRIFDKLGVSSRTELLIYFMGSLATTPVVSKTAAQINGELQKQPVKPSELSPVQSRAAIKKVAQR